MKNIIGLDFGGTSVKVGVVTPEGRLLKKDLIPINSLTDFDAVISPVLSWIGDFLRENSEIGIDAVGIGTPGFIDKKTNILIAGSENLPAIKSHSIAGVIEEKFGIPSFADNDATCAAAGELIFGVGREYSDFIMITLGTGIGGGLVLNGKVYRGFRGFAGELGHVCVDPNGPQCNCGGRGCFEQYSSGPAMVREYKRMINNRGIEISEEITPKLIFDRAKGGEEVALLVVEEACHKIAQVFGTLLNVLNVRALVIGGGISKAGSIITDKVKKYLPDFVWPELLRGVDVVIAKLQNDAGVLGAAAQAIERLRNDI